MQSSSRTRSLPTSSVIKSTTSHPSCLWSFTNSSSSSSTSTSSSSPSPSSSQLSRSVSSRSSPSSFSLPSRAHSSYHPSCLLPRLHRNLRRPLSFRPPRHHGQGSLRRLPSLPSRSRSQLCSIPHPRLHSLLHQRSPSDLLPSNQGRSIIEAPGRGSGLAREESESSSGYGLAQDERFEWDRVRKNGSVGWGDGLEVEGGRAELSGDDG